jgi:phosphohistidine phosphatase
VTTIFLRHADAAPSVTGDFDRELTAKGLDQADRVGRYCAQIGLIPGVIKTSPVVRARQTAELVAKRLGGIPVHEAGWLACGMRPETCANEIGSAGGEGPIFVVGHEPDFSMTIEWFLGSRAGSVHVRKASLIALNISAFQAGGACLEFLIPARMMPARS